MFEIIQVARDEESFQHNVQRYKAFRLLALETAPEAFGSNYAREAAFTDDMWQARLRNPDATTFLIVESGRVLCTITAVGPLLCAPEE